MVMASRALSGNEAPTVWAMGALPPPVTGMSILTDKVVQRLVARTSVTIADWSSRDEKPRPHTRLIRLLRNAKCLLKLVFHGRVQDGRLYLCSNSKGGLIMTGLMIKAARHLGYKVYLHHHVYAYIDKYDKKMAWVDRNMSADDVHLMHCPQMINDFRAKYASTAQFVFVYPSIASLPLSQPRTRFSEPFRMGHLSNLTVEKGLSLVLDTFRELHKRKRNVQLILAGPFGTEEAERLTTEALEQYPESVRHIGPVYNQQKLDYFNSIDCFLFPTQYDCEAWPIALNEALDAGLPVIVTNRGAIRTMLGGHAGPIFEDNRYVNQAASQVEEWIDSPQAYSAVSLATIEQARLLREESAKQFDALVTSICSPVETKQIEPAAVIA
jgi:glycosyltransferase involved in cell wall biosynthesis